MSSKLECPFCGGTDVLQERDGVHCEDCGGSAPALAAWNLRTPDWRALALEAGKALEPVVALLQRHNDSQRDTSPVFAVNDAELTFGDLRRATHALAAIKATGLEE